MFILSLKLLYLLCSSIDSESHFSLALTFSAIFSPNDDNNNNNNDDDDNNNNNNNVTCGLPGIIEK